MNWELFVTGGLSRLARGRRGSHLDRSAITLVVCEASLECGGVGDGALVVVGARMKF